jgi:hypothetical protein
MRGFILSDQGFELLTADRAMPKRALQVRGRRAPLHPELGFSASSWQISAHCSLPQTA